MNKTTYILGINDGHLATAALLKDGKIIACVSEERFTGIKNQPGIPTRAIKHCLSFAGISEESIDLVVFGGNLIPPKAEETESISIKLQIYKVAKFFLTKIRLLSIYLPVLRDIEEFAYSLVSDLVCPIVQKERINRLCKEFNFNKPKIRFFDHHFTHAVTALYSSGFIGLHKPLLVFTCDGEGDKLSASVSVYQNGEIMKISDTSMTNSLGNLYRSVTKYLGMKPLEHEYKVMGLAAYVNDKKIDTLYEKIKDLVTVDSKSLQIKTRVNSQLFKLGYLDAIFKEWRFDYISSAVQRITENVLVNWIEASIKKTGICTILLSGGVFMNVKANQRISEIDLVQKMFVQPSCGDESNAIGAAYWGYKEISGQDPKPLNTLYLGPDFSEADIKNELVKLNNDRCIIQDPKNMEITIARLLAKGEIVARFSGRSEWGARALGNRSILADASRLEVIGTINKMIKSRDFWMPFAPVIMKPYQKEYVLNPKNVEAPFMIITLDTTEKGKKDLAAAMHQYDKTVRPQILDQRTNPEYYKIIEEFSKITGRYGLLNTSFNLHGNPIVGTPEEAILTFVNSGLKYLAIGPFLVEKISSS